MYAPLAQAKLWYEDSGGPGDAVVLLHAGTGSSRSWSRQLEALRAAGLRAIAYDRCGHGRSEGPGGVSAADDLLALADHLMLERFHAVGTAAGAIVALDFALSFPQRLRTVVFANSHGGVQDEDYLALQRRLRPSPQFAALPPEVRELGPAYRAENPAGTEEWLKIEREARVPGAPILPKTRNRITFQALEGLAVPALLLTGDADLYAPPPVLELFRRRIPKSSVAVIPSCGHSAYWEQPERFNRAVLDFFSAGGAS